MLSEIILSGNLISLQPQYHFYKTDCSPAVCFIFLKTLV